MVYKHMTSSKNCNYFTGIITLWNNWNSSSLMQRSATSASLFGRLATSSWTKQQTQWRSLKTVKQWWIFLRFSVMQRLKLVCAIVILVYNSPVMTLRDNQRTMGSFLDKTDIFSFLSFNETLISSNSLDLQRSTGPYTLNASACNKWIEYKLLQEQGDWKTIFLSLNSHVEWEGTKLVQRS